MAETRPEPSPFLQPDAPLAGLAREYLDALHRGDRAAAMRMVTDAVQGGTFVRDVYLYVFQPVLYEVGRLWQLNRISVAQEHYFTAATQQAMSMLYPYIFRNEPRGHVVVAACVGPELHEVGIRMVADFFEMEGWDSHYLGANLPPDEMVTAIARHRPHVAALSATMSWHVDDVVRCIRALRRRDDLQGVRILVGGHGFRYTPDLWRSVGADGYAEDAERAVRVATELVGGRAA
jgi:methanogenic corrinoid protein MtbC1